MPINIVVQETEQALSIHIAPGVNDLLSTSVRTKIEQMRFDPDTFASIHLVWRFNIRAERVVAMKFVTKRIWYDCDAPKRINEILAPENVQLHWLQTVNRVENIGQIIEFVLEPYNAYSYEALRPYKFPLAEALADLLSEKEYALLYNTLACTCRALGSTDIKDLTLKLFPPMPPPESVLHEAPDI